MLQRRLGLHTPSQHSRTLHLKLLSRLHASDDVVDVFPSACCYANYSCTAPRRCWPSVHGLLPCLHAGTCHRRFLPTLHAASAGSRPAVLACCRASCCCSALPSCKRVGLALCGGAVASACSLHRCECIPLLLSARGRARRRISRTQCTLSCCIKWWSFHLNDLHEHQFISGRACLLAAKPRSAKGETSLCRICQRHKSPQAKVIRVVHGVYCFTNTSALVAFPISH
jgi:hypothetical protein